MARLNELPVSSDSLETLRKKMLRQNRDLAKSNNIRALRIRELENECACMLSENLELRGRILELEKQAEDNEARRIADHALAIKDKLESQLTEWGILIAGLGLEPPMKRHSPIIRKTTKRRMSYSTNRPSPSQRRLRDIAKDIEELGHISETKPCSRQSMNHEQIMALRSEADLSDDSPQLGPPPISKFIEEEPVKIDSPSRTAPDTLSHQSPAGTPKTKKLLPPIAFPSPKSETENNTALSPGKKLEPSSQRSEEAGQPENSVEASPLQTIKAGSKRKLSARDEHENVPLRKLTNENGTVKALTGRPRGRPPKALAGLRKDLIESSEKPRKPLAAKSANHDISSPKKNHQAKAAALDEVAVAKAKTNSTKPKPIQDGTKAKPKDALPVKVDALPTPDIKPPVPATVDCDLAAPIAEPGLLSPSSPEIVAPLDSSRGDTPPPTDISSSGETSRPSRRNRTTVSYAEPNLRDKMRRPTKELFDAVAGEGRYARRTSQFDPAAPEQATVKRESNSSELLQQIPPGTVSIKTEPASIPTSPLAPKNSSLEDLPSSVVTERRKRVSNVVPKPMEAINLDAKTLTEDNKDASITSLDRSEITDVDVYEFTSSSPYSDQDVKETKRGNRRQTTSSRRSAIALEEDSSLSAQERSSARRRSMMV